MRRKWVQFLDLAATEDKKRRMTKGKRDEKERDEGEKKGGWGKYTDGKLDERKTNDEQRSIDNSSKMRIGFRNLDPSEF